MSQDRIPPVPPEQLSGAKKDAHDHLTSTLLTYFGPNLNETFKTTGVDGSLIGPLPTLVQYPALAKPYFDLLNAIGQLSSLSAEVRETAILTVGGIYRCEYELYAHMRVAAKTRLSQEQIEALSQGSTPMWKESERQCEAAWAVSSALTRNKGPLDQELWDKGVKSLGLDSMMALVNYVAAYSYTCVVLNAVNASVPPE